MRVVNQEKLLAELDKELEAITKVEEQAKCEVEKLNVSEEAKTRILGILKSEYAKEHEEKVHFLCQFVDEVEDVEEVVEVAQASEPAVAIGEQPNVDLSRSR